MIDLTYKHDIQVQASTGIASFNFLRWIRDLLGRLNTVSPKVGDIRASVDPNLRVGELGADGSDVSRTTYAALFALVGTTFGAGNGTTTFTLPDMTSILADVHFFVRVD